MSPSDEWKSVLFKEIYLKAGEGGTPDTKKEEYYKDGDIPFVKIEHLSDKYLNSIDSYITPKGLEKSGAWIVPADSLLFSNGATIGEKSINLIPVTTKQGILGIILKDGYSVEFLYYYLDTKIIKSKINALTTKGTMPIVYLKDLDKMKIDFPNYEKQLEIANIISSYDNEIVLQKSKLENLKIQYKAMQGLLLSGIVRV